jgi:hypothetical protein
MLASPEKSGVRLTVAWQPLFAYVRWFYSAHTNAGQAFLSISKGKNPNILRFDRKSLNGSIYAFGALWNMNRIKPIVSGQFYIASRQTLHGFNMEFNSF